MSNLGALLAQQPGGGGNSSASRGGGSFTFHGGQERETPEHMASLGEQEEPRLDASSELFAGFVMPENKPNGEQKKAVPYAGGDQQNQNAASITDLQQMWANAVNASDENGEGAANPQKQLTEFNEFIQTQAKTLDFFPAERQAALSDAFQKADVGAISKCINEAMQDMAVNVMNTAFALVQQKG